MDRYQISPRRRTYFTVVCVLLIAFALLVAGCTSKESGSSAGSSAVSSPVGGAQPGDMVEIDYTGTLANGSEFDSSKGRGPFSFVIGDGTAIAGFDNEIRGMKVGDNKKFTLTPDKAYGEYDPSLKMAMPIDFVPPEENITIGESITLFNGQSFFPAKIIDVNATNITFDLNSPLAGQTLTFEVSLVNLTPASEVAALMNQTIQAASPIDLSSTGSDSLKSENKPVDTTANKTA
ncbi:MAG TPA: peptidylprolyl isomerase [Methanospirillum sp.]|nr:peptidylprolyl isomerase [Methanospirillum sp.]